LSRFAGSADISIWIIAALFAFACADRDAVEPRFEDAGISTVDGGGADGGASRRRDGGAVSMGATDGGGAPVLPPEIILVEARTMTPASGPAAGGTQITITGRGFVAGTTVTVGGAPLQNVMVSGERRITGTTPPGSAGVAPVLVRNRAGQAEVAGGYTYIDDTSITAVSPARGPRSGGTEITIDGAGFVAGSHVLVGARPALFVRVVSPVRILAVTPSGAAPGPHAVSVVHRNGATTRDDAFTYVDVPSAFVVQPAVGPLAGGNTARLTLSGPGLTLSGARVYFGARSSPTVSVISATELDAIVPGGERAGAVDVSLASPDGVVLAPGAYAYFEGGSVLSVQAVVPASGPPEGGTRVRVAGSAFDTGVTEVLFDATPAPSIALESANVLRVTTPPGVGTANVTVRALGGREASLAAAFRYESPLALTSIAPDSGPVVGGTLIELRGQGFASGAEVFFGPLAAIDVTVVDATTLRARTPASVAGPTDVFVRVRGAVATLPRAFQYFDETRLHRIAPNRGGIAGGTFVTLTGTGFGAASHVFFNGAPAVEVRLVDPFTITARTPPGAVGRADVTVTGDRGAAFLPAAYEYFDPAVALGGTSGGTVRGAVNVTVLHGASGERLPGAFTTLAVSGHSLYQGITNRMGQVVFSGPGLAGRQIVTAVKEGFSASTVVAFDAENVTLYLNPLNIMIDFGPGGGELGTIRGVIKDAFKGIPPAPQGFERVVLVTTTLADRFTPNPDAPGVVEVYSDDGNQSTDVPFEIASRAGDLAVYALAGHIGHRGTVFVPFQMGIARFLRMPVGGTIEGVEITVGTSLSARLDATLLNAPNLHPDGPTAYRMRVFLELGADGVVTFFQLPESTTEPRVVQEHLVPLNAGVLPGARYTVVAGAYNVVDGDEYSPLAVYTLEDVTDLSAPVLVGPLMSLATPVSPGDFDFLEEDRFEWALVTPPEPTFHIVYVLQPVGLGLASIWELIVPGHVRDIPIPDLRSLGGLGGLPPSEVLFWVIVSAQGPRFSIDAFDYTAFESRRWRTYSFAPYLFITN
jgi:hypothetical protein